MKSKTKKRNFNIFLISIIIAILYCYIKAESGGTIFGLGTENMELVQQGISEKVVRFHVVANSDSQDDQDLKLKVKEAVVSYISPILAKSEDIHQSKKILSERHEQVLQIANDIIRLNGYNYVVTAGFEYTYFPTKSYGAFTFPPGNYEAFMIRIGESKGKNWWCVLYPPLCFVDISHGIVDQESGEMLEGILTTEEFDIVSGKNIGFKFKYFTFLNNIFGL